MKTKLFFGTAMLIATIACGQNWMLKEVEVVVPTFKGNKQKSIDEFLRKKLDYPTEAAIWKQQGTEVVQFVVTTEGKLTDFKVINSVSYEIDKEVIRALKSTSGKWLPGTTNGNPVAMETEVSMAFKLNPKDNFVEMAKWNFQKGNELLFSKEQPKKALKYFDWAINFLPNDETLLAIRGICKYKMGDENGAIKDLDRSDILARRKGTTINFGNFAKNQNNLKYIEKMMLSARK
jgi:TonB family protein